VYNFPFVSYFLMMVVLCAGRNIILINLNLLQKYFVTGNTLLAFVYLYHEVSHLKISMSLVIVVGSRFYELCCPSVWWVTYLDNVGRGFPLTVVNQLLDYMVSYPEDRNVHLYPFVGSRFRSWWPGAQKCCRRCMRQYLKTETMKTHGTLPHISSTVREMWSEETDMWEKIFFYVEFSWDVMFEVWRLFIQFALKTEVAVSSEALVTSYQITRLHVPENCSHYHRFRAFYLTEGIFVPRVL